MEQYLGWIFLASGGISRVFIPWLNARRSDPELSWSWRYIWPQLATLLVAALLLPLTVDLKTVGALEITPAYLVGWGATDIGRLLDKIVTKN